MVFSKFMISEIVCNKYDINLGSWMATHGNIFWIMICFCCLLRNWITFLILLWIEFVKIWTQFWVHESISFYSLSNKHTTIDKYVLYILFGSIKLKFIISFIKSFRMYWHSFDIWERDSHVIKSLYFKVST